MSKVIVITPEELTQLIETTLQKALSKKQAKHTPSYPNLLDINQAAELLGLSKSSIYSKTSKRKIPHIKRGKKLYFKHPELIQWLEQGKQRTTEEIAQDANLFLSTKKKRRS